LTQLPSYWPRAFKLHLYAALAEKERRLIVRARQLRTWQRRWKVELIERVNPRWDDLSRRLMARSLVGTSLRFLANPRIFGAAR